MQERPYKDLTWKMHGNYWLLYVFYCNESEILTAHKIYYAILTLPHPKKIVFFVCFWIKMRRNSENREILQRRRLYDTLTEDKRGGTMYAPK